ncbi:trehalose-6-phosphate synthase [uncultured Cohaesibacter sp.]|uniref:trehalose-6-phosphate synthase n=1 Tax=uncultured Cohaesibacter sp. TaxID=1002546 RepID=UPI0029C705A8|nr:trehalose-6-phosphate synthase [uncultured Cohaesibacter sp.]
MRPDLRIAFFHHTPFPSADMFNILPWRKEIIEKACCSSDVVGFHIPRYAANFVSAASSLLDVEVLRRELVSEDMIFEGTALTERRVPTLLSWEDREIGVSVCSRRCRCRLYHRVRQ